VVIETGVASPEDLESFKDWLMATVSGDSRPDGLNVDIQFAKRDLPRLIKIVRDAERYCLEQEQERVRRNSSKRRGEAGKTEWWDRAMGLIVKSGEDRWWNWRVLWLQDIRIYLNNELERCQAKGQPTH
jgi:hypothetical protein